MCSECKLHTPLTSLSRHLRLLHSFNTINAAWKVITLFLPNKYIHSTIAWFSSYLTATCKTMATTPQAQKKIQFEDILHGTGPTNSWLNADTLRFCYCYWFPLITLILEVMHCYPLSYKYSLHPLGSLLWEAEKKLCNNYRKKF